MNFRLLDGDLVQATVIEGNFVAIQKVFLPRLEEITSIIEDDGSEIPISIDFETVETSRRKVYFCFNEEKSDSGTLPEQEESDYSYSDVESSAAVNLQSIEDWLGTDFSRSFEEDELSDELGEFQYAQ